MCSLKGGENNMKKLLAVVIIATLAVGIGLSVPKAKNQAGDPPIGAPVQTALMHTMGDPPIG